MEEGGGQREEKQHRKRQAGRKAEKKKAKNKHEQEQTDQQRNPKAYAFHSVNKVARSVRRTLDIREKRHHVPVVDRTPVEPPPVIIAVVGPPQVGKSTLVQCLIKSFTRTKLSNVRGPVTIVSGKKRRLSIIECNNDINSMIDIAKVADLVLLLVDASFGFEMEIFEFLNICQVHGFPKIMGVLTHLDHFRDNKTLRKTKKRLKHRFWTEVYQGAKLFYLSGMVNGEYQKTEIHNLGRFISVMKFRPLQWRTTHPYMLADRIEDVTDPEAVRQDPKMDRSICLYGYVRGTHFKNHSNVHIPGCGDFLVRDLSLLPDPCPLPDRDGKRRRLEEKERSLYAPFSGVGGVVYDKDAVYIDTGGSHFHTTVQEEVKPSNELVSGLIDTKKTLDEKMEDSELTLFTGGPTISSSTFTQPVAVAPPSELLVTDAHGRQRRKAVFADSGKEESDGSDEEEEEAEDGGEDKMEEGEEEESEEEEGDGEEEEEGSEEEEESEEDEPKIQSKPPKKRTKVDLEQFDFADSDDELERSKNTQSKKQKQKKQKKQKSLQKVASESSDEEDESGGEDADDVEMEDSDSVSEDSEESDSDDEEAESTKPPPPASSNKTTNNIKNKINEALAKINKKTKELQEQVDEESDAESESGEESGLGSGEESGDGEEEDEEGSGQEENTEIGHLKWKENLAGRAQDAFYRRQSEATNLRKLVYGQVHEAAGEDEEGEEDEVGGLFRVAKRHNEQRASQCAAANSIDCSRFSVDTIQDWDLEEVMAQIRDCFVTGNWDANEDAETLLKQDDELYGDFEDLETGEKHTATGDGDGEKESGDDDSEGSGDEREEDEDKPNVYETPEELRLRKSQEKRAAKKARLKEMFDREYDDKDGDGEKGTHYDALKAEMEDQAQLNRKEFESMDEETRSQYEGFRPGLYVRVQVDNMPCEFIDNFDPTYPIILGALNSAEQNIGCVQVRLKKHRWHKKILKTRDPLVLSLGWRRFQSVVLYSIQDHNMRHRLLKYTPEHLHCNATFWGPITPQGTGVLAIQTLSGKTANFRICATGVVLELDKSMTIVKKLKLTGTPQKIYKKTAFIEGMFTSALEVSRFEGASIRTVSGVRGQIKKAAKTPEGAFRATFEDKILLSDIAFVRTWYPVAIPRFYNPVTTLLLPPSEKEKWLGMKTVGQLKREAGLRQQVNEDHLYKDIHRKPKMFKPLRVPKDLQRALPFKDKPKEARHSVDAVQAGRVAVVRDAKEKKVAELMSMLKVLHENKMKQRRSTMRERAAQHQKQTARIDAKRQAKQKEVKKQIYRVLGKKERRKER